MSTTTKAKRAAAAAEERSAVRAFACAALTGMLSNPNMKNRTLAEVVSNAWYVAEQMWEEELGREVLFQKKGGAR
jgi:hypothetical protein